ncbi:hypothetical protein [Campylobacter hyointestinalis]|uniref:Uncharacterized protein n=1 Tax=Campylobacter hyointestinalis subsp. hyointestinalis TaxID=91352 RepID=A0A855NEG0_CAMHY|nr:hypothetical protein [Campylobacter hyointestinalis]PPB54961.1 hypothetical protein CDQ69_02550 [Campylobacter hyointestinalis subsp. hyointestinalis]PPB58591.1 hypothetical protein CDQ70_04560 [Campylobacter hyointestinalis subsp. hyointestinalis]PPB60498.1 hypothetical protein CDQ72_07870 [Campylobacter hyointestinalis subsp. hyointestinalis]PPB61911.1 hypothetical protein CDQ74_07595 [Campylobacter hyointestinalis subsp. hyointestinalis]PPB64884.1 hypothetical protein CDQ73_03365 [Campyl
MKTNTQAKRLETMMEIENMREKGWEIGLNAKGELCGIRRGKLDIKRAFDKTGERELARFKRSMIKGQKAFYSDQFFRLIGEGIYERETMRLVDILSA